MSAFTKVGLLAFGATRGALGTRDDINDDLTIVFAAIRAGAVRDSQSAAFALGKAHPGNAVVATAFSRLGMISTHSDYHISRLYRL